MVHGTACLHEARQHLIYHFRALYKRPFLQWFFVIGMIFISSQTKLCNILIVIRGDLAPSGQQLQVFSISLNPFHILSRSAT